MRCQFANAGTWCSHQCNDCDLRIAARKAANVRADRIKGNRVPISSLMGAPVAR